MQSQELCPGSIPKLMAFEKLSKPGSGRSGNVQPKISLRKSGSIGINTPALEEFFPDAEGVVLHFDEEENKLGLEPVDDLEEDEDAYTLSRSDSGGSVAPSSVLKRFDLVPEITTQYSPEIHKQNQHTEYVVIDLDDPIGTYGSRDEEEDEEE